VNVAAADACTEGREGAAGGAAGGAGGDAGGGVGATGGGGVCVFGLVVFDTGADGGGTDGVSGEK